jgi:hypothetical protein
MRKTKQTRHVPCAFADTVVAAFALPRPTSKLWRLSMNATTKKLVISALVLGLSGGVYAQTAGGSMGAGGNGSSGSGSAAAGKGGNVGAGMGGTPDSTTGTGVKSGMGNDTNNGMSQDQDTVRRSAPNNGNMNSGSMNSNGMSNGGTKKPY